MIRDEFPIEECVKLFLHLSATHEKSSYKKSYDRSIKEVHDRSVSSIVISLIVEKRYENLRVEKDSQNDHAVCNAIAKLS